MAMVSFSFGKGNILLITKLSTGDSLFNCAGHHVLLLSGTRKVLSTSPLNGGYRETIKAIFNYDENTVPGELCELKAPTYEEHMRMIVKELGLNPQKTTGLSTAASMDKAAIQRVAFEDISVTAIVTGGVEKNGGRAGDPASFHERGEKIESLLMGTINIVLVIDADLTPGALTSALVTCTEAKTAALQELMAGSNYSYGLATGSGTDGTVLVCNAESPTKLTIAGKHAKLGELIGRVVKSAVKKALCLDTQLTPVSQHSVFRRLKRYGITEVHVLAMSLNWDRVADLSKDEIVYKLHELDKAKEIVVLTSLYVHLLDQLDWQLLSVDEAIGAGEMLLNQMIGKLKIKYHPAKVLHQSREEVIGGMLENLRALLATAVGGESVVQGSCLLSSG